MNIITLTLNPAIDIHCETESFEPFCENLVGITSNDAGGKGINISRALTENKIENKAYVVVGNENGDAFLKQLSSDNIEYKDFFVDGRIRENITIHSKNQPETRISFSGFCANEKLLESIKEALKQEKIKDSIITFTGRAPDGIGIETIKEFLISLKSEGAKIVIDSRSFSKKDIIDVGPWLIKPNEEEIKMYSDEEITDAEKAKEIANTLKCQGIENVIISLGAKGAVLACVDGVFFVKSPEINVVSTIGAGDSMIAGFISAISDGKSYEDALKTAISYGSAACLTNGTKPPRKEDIEAILQNIEMC